LQEALRRCRGFLFLTGQVTVRIEEALFVDSRPIDSGEISVTENNKAIDQKTVRRYYRPIEVVQQTGLGKSTVMEAIWSGELEAYRKGRAWLVPVDAVDRWIRGGEEVAA
jgi:excisionase family DNA binding protein